jgi:hypothetical protein
MGDRSDYTDTGMRGPDRREGFGDDQGTRVGRPDGAREASQSHGARPGQPGTNRDPVPDGIEGSIMDEDAGQARGAQERRSEDDALHASGAGSGSGPEQSRVQEAAHRAERTSNDPSLSDDVNRAAGDNRRVDDL